MDGCLIECTEGHFLLVDPRNGGSWQCVEENPNIGSICPGKFNTGNKAAMLDIVEYVILNLKNLSLIHI